MINEVHSFAFQGRYSKSNVGHLLCPLFTPMCERDSYLGRHLQYSNETVDPIKLGNIIYFLITLK